MRDRVAVIDSVVCINPRDSWKSGGGRDGIFGLGVAHTQRLHQHQFAIDDDAPGRTGQPHSLVRSLEELLHGGQGRFQFCDSLGVGETSGFRREESGGKGEYADAHTPVYTRLSEVLRGVSRTQTHRPPPGLLGGLRLPHLFQRVT